jgi:hypothetical protein
MMVPIPGLAAPAAPGLSAQAPARRSGTVRKQGIRAE